MKVIDSSKLSFVNKFVEGLVNAKLYEFRNVDNALLVENYKTVIISTDGGMDLRLDIWKNDGKYYVAYGSIYQITFLVEKASFDCLWEITK